MTTKLQNWRTLCEAASNEGDSQRLRAIIAKLLETLDGDDLSPRSADKDLSRNVVFPTVEP